MNIKNEIMLFYNDLLEYRMSIQGQKLSDMFTYWECYGEIDIVELENAINDYYYARNNDKLRYYSDDDLELAKKQDKYIASLYKELN